MKLSLLIALTLVFSAAVFAKSAPVHTSKRVKMNKMTKTTSTNTSKFDVRVPIKKWFKKNNNNFRIGMAQGSLETNVRARRTNVDQSFNETANTRLNIMLGWEQIKTKEVAYNAFFTYQDLANAFDGEDVRSMRLSANATWGINKQAYTYGGLNLNDYFGSEEIENSVDAGIGYQLGLGFKFHKRANVELEYLALLNEGSNAGNNLDVETKGILVKLTTPFTFDI